MTINIRTVIRSTLTSQANVDINYKNSQLHLTKRLLTQMVLIGVKYTCKPPNFSAAAENLS